MKKLKSKSKKKKHKQINWNLLVLGLLGVIGVLVMFFLWKDRELTFMKDNSNSLNMETAKASSSADLSYLTIMISKEVDMMVLSPEGDVAKDGVNTFEDSGFEMAYPIENLSAHEEDSGVASWEFWKSKPSSGEYTISLTSKTAGIYDLEISLLDASGEEFLHELKVNLTPKKETVYILTVDNQTSENSSLLKIN